MEIRAASASAKLRQSHRNDKRIELTTQLLVLNGTSVRRATDLEKTANMNLLPFWHSLTRSTGVRSCIKETFGRTINYPLYEGQYKAQSSPKAQIL